MFSIFKKSPCVSVVVIAYNREQYIEECLDSILGQDIEKEIICIDDASTDDTYAILSRYAKEHKEIKVYQNTVNKGTVWARYEGIKHCKGQYLLFIDADDKILPDSLPLLFKEAINKKVDVLEFCAQTDGSEEFQKALVRDSLHIQGDVLQAYKDHAISNQLWNKLFSQSVYKQVVKYGEPKNEYSNFSDVVYFLIHFLFYANSFSTSSTFGYFYYDNRGMTATISEIDRLKEYCGFGIVKRDLEDIYGKMPALTDRWNIVCNQAIVTWCKLPEQDQKKYKHLLLTLMSQKAMDKLIPGIQELLAQQQK